MKAHIQPTLLIWVIYIMILLSSCNMLNKYALYIPDEDSKIMLNFEYPLSWEWIEEEGTIMYTFDPAKPTPEITKAHPGSDVGIIQVIETRVSNPCQLMDEYIASHNQATNNLGGSLIQDKTITIGDTQARWLSRKMPPVPEISQNFDVYSVAVYYCLEYRLYLFFLTVPYKEMDSDFVQGFEHMISTIQVIP